jgi:hypothetical protein
MTTAKAYIPTTTATKVDWTEIDDSALVSGLLDNDAQAWHEFWRRFDSQVARRISAYLAAFYSLRSTDTIDEIKSEFYEAILTNDRARLRDFSPDIVPLGAWLGLIAEQIACKHLMRAARLRERFDLVDASVLDDTGSDDASDSPLLDALHGVQYLVGDEDTRNIYAWFGGPRVHVYDVLGHERRSFLARPGEKYPTQEDARRAIADDRRVCAEGPKPPRKRRSRAGRRK